MCARSAAQRPRLLAETRRLGLRQRIAARDTLLRWLGFTHRRWDEHARCVMSEPGSVGTAILSAAVDVHGLPISYLFRARDLSDVGRPFAAEDIDGSTLRRSVNHHLLERGAAWPQHPRLSGSLWRAR